MYVVFLKETGHGCMCAIYPSICAIWMTHLNKIGIIILKKWRFFPFKANVMQRIERESELYCKRRIHLSTYCMFLQESCFLLKGRPCLQGNWFQEVKSFLKKWSYKKHNKRMSFIRGCIAFFHILYGSAVILLYLRKYHQDRL